MHTSTLQQSGHPIQTPHIENLSIHPNAIGDCVLDPYWNGNQLVHPYWVEEQLLHPDWAASNHASALEANKAWLRGASVLQVVL